MKALATIALTIATALFAAAPAIAQDTENPAPYGVNDAGGFLNILPPGEHGLDNAVQLATFRATGAKPPHFDDQQAMYDGLVDASPHLTAAELPGFFKDATFGVQTTNIERIERPRPGVTIVRDQYDVPHIYGTTRADTMFGAGYAGAEDRLFLMDVLRHTARAQLSSFVGGAAGNRAMDAAQWQLAPYTEADLQKQLDSAQQQYGADGAAIVADVEPFVDGINAYVDAALMNPLLLPGEYLGVGKMPTHWAPTDIIAEASLIGTIFGKGGGGELPSALTLQAFQKRFGAAKGRRAWEDVREANDPEAPTTVRGKAFPYETTSPFSRRGLALPDPGSVLLTPTDAAPRPPATGRAVPPLGTPVPPQDGSLGSQLMASLYGGGGLASNWELISARASATHHPLAVLGPQVGYYVPQILLDEDLHGPGIDARGAAFPGVNLYVELGHGRDYAWSATTATSDNVDTYAEVLCQDDLHYLYKGQCLPMERLERTNSWSPNLQDSTPSGTQTLVAYRTVHGVVIARGTVGGKKVAFTSARTTYFHEADSALGFRAFNDPAAMTGPQAFQAAAAKINFGFNWAYVDADHIAYLHSGYFPQRPKGTSPDFPILGTGEYDWRGYDPANHTIDQLPISRHPQAIDPTYMVSWNNKQAPRWSSADDKYTFGPVYRSQMISERVARAVRTAGGAHIEQLVQAMEEPATEDVRMVELWPILRRALGRPSDARLRDAIATLQAWYADGGHRRDLDHDGVDEHNDAIRIMDAWWPRLLDAEFHPVMGDAVFGALRRMVGFGGITPGATPVSYPAFSDGWFGYVSKDLRDVFTPRKVRGPWSVRYCGHGRQSRCRMLVRQTLRQALDVSAATIYGHGACTGNPQASCFDKDRATSASAITLPPGRFQNRPTFQQVVTLERHLPR